MGLKPEYLMLSLWLFLLLIEAFTKVTFFLSSTYRPWLTNDVFIQHRARRLFVLTVFPPVPPPPHTHTTCEGVGIRAVSTTAESIGHSSRVASCSATLVTPGQGEDPEKGVVTSAGCQLAFQISAAFSRPSRPPVQP